MNEEVKALVKELDQIGSDKIIQPHYKSRRACAKAADLIRELYAESRLDRETTES